MGVAALPVGDGGILTQTQRRAASSGQGGEDVRTGRLDAVACAAAFGPDWRKDRGSSP